MRWANVHVCQYSTVRTHVARRARTPVACSPRSMQQHACMLHVPTYMHTLILDLPHVLHATCMLHAKHAYIQAYTHTYTPEPIPITQFRVQGAKFQIWSRLDKRKGYLKVRNTRSVQRETTPHRAGSAVVRSVRGGSGGLVCVCMYP